MRKSLRLLIDDNPEALEEVENDISYVYSGYAPISVRLVQCVAQKNGVISNPALERTADKSTTSSNVGTANPNASEVEATDNNTAARKLHAHPIVGWKGFEDVLSTLPGKTFDIPRKAHTVANANAGVMAVPTSGKCPAAFAWGECGRVLTCKCRKFVSVNKV